MKIPIIKNNSNNHLVIDLGTRSITLRAREEATISDSELDSVQVRQLLATRKILVVPEESSAGSSTKPSVKKIPKGRKKTEKTKLKGSKKTEEKKKPKGTGKKGKKKKS